MIALLEARDGPVSVQQIEREVNERRSRIEGMLKVLEVDGAVERVEGGWRRTREPWVYDTERVEHVTELRRDEQRAMRDYGATTECRMLFLRAQLDDAGGAPCGRCDNCTGARWDVALDPSLVVGGACASRAPGADDRAPAHVAERLPRAQGQDRGCVVRCRWGGRCAWPATAVGAGWLRARGSLGRRCLMRWWTPLRGWCVRGRPILRPEWVTYVPSSSAPDLVAGFARQLADALGLELRDVLRRTRAGKPQREMANSAQQFANVLDAFTVDGPIPSAPVLLIDDLVDSRWTLTTVGTVLLDAGSGPVYPLALAQSTGD